MTLRRMLGPLKRWLLLHRELFLDGRRFLAAVPGAGSASPHARYHLESDIVRRYHVLEKGLAMPEFRPGFGVSMVQQLIGNLREWRSLQLPVEGQIAAAEAVLRAYRDRHVEIGFDLGDLFTGVEIGEPCKLGSGGVRSFQEVPARLSDAFEELVRLRASVRSFDVDRVPGPDMILDAVATASRAPSVCNRQTARVHAYTGGTVQELLKFQNGNRGFGHRVPLLFIITSDLRFFTGVSERNQAWIDGGMFAMLFLLALQAKGLGAVALNWSVTNQRDTELRNAAEIPSYERIIMLIGCGYPAPDAMVPVSQRRPANETTHFHYSL